MRALILTIFLSISHGVFAQADSSAKSIYDRSQDSVFLIYTNDSSGTPNSLGSGFMVGAHTIVTNAHVIAGGNPVLAVGPVRIPLKVLQTDVINDLAVLSVDADLTSKPLSLATGAASPGESVFAIGNPEGLEKTISQGIVSGVRVRDGKDLIQITSPISHGSSGGPILNSRGEVIGVAVGMLEDGQNLNFAVPVAKLRALLNHETVSLNQPVDVNTTLEAAKALLMQRQNEDYSDDPGSPYQRDSKQLTALLQPLEAASGTPETLSKLACLGTEAVDLSDIGIRAARKLVQSSPSAANRALLAYTLLDRADDESMVAALAKAGSDDMIQANASEHQFANEAKEEATTATRMRGAPILASFVLGTVANEAGDYAESISLLTPVTGASLQVCDNDLSERSYREIISATDQLKQPEASEKWFRNYAAQYKPTAYEWDSEGDRRAKVKDYLKAGDAYERAANLEPSLGYDFCYAAVDVYGLPGAEDTVLADGRKCVDASLQKGTKISENNFKSELPSVYRVMAVILEGRGVYQEAKEYIKESLSLSPDDPLSLSSEADVFADLEQYSECIAAENAAIRASDGKYPWMHFRLGYCYFHTENWSQAANSFRIAAEGDKTDAVSAYDLGLCMSRQGFEDDARNWYREALNRKPDEELRAKILASLR